jgi:prepilin-type N-terminal cleavage/methylation domain-containing protein
MLAHLFRHRLARRRVFGFTLIELIVAIVILGLLAAMVVAYQRATVDRTHDEVAVTELKALHRAAAALSSMDGHVRSTRRCWLKRPGPRPPPPTGPARPGWRSPHGPTTSTQSSAPATARRPTRTVRSPGPTTPAAPSSAWRCVRGPTGAPGCGPTAPA